LPEARASRARRRPASSRASTGVRGRVSGGNLRRGRAFLGVAILAAGDEVAVRIAARVRAGDDVVETLHLRGENAQTIEATPGFASMDGVTEGVDAEEVLVFEVDAGPSGMRGRLKPSSWPAGATLGGRSARISSGRRTSAT